MCDPKGAGSIAWSSVPLLRDFRNRAGASINNDRRLVVVVFVFGSGLEHGATWQNALLNASAGLSTNNFGGWQGNSTERSKEWLPKEQLLGHIKLGLTKRNGSIYYRNDFLHETITSFGNVNVNTQQAVS